MRVPSCLVVLSISIRVANADDPPPSDASPAPPATDAGPGEVIEVAGSAPAHAGAIRLDGDAARKAPGALGEPLRALALLPGVATSIAASGYPIIRGTLPGESRYVFDGIELPMLYHLLLGNQVIHPALIDELELRAGGHGAEHGHLLGGLITMAPARAEQARTELHANLVEIGAYRSQALSKATSIAVAARAGTLGAAAKIYDSAHALYYVDQTTRIVHRLGNGDVLTLTSLGAFDHAKLPPDPNTQTIQLGFHRLDGRWLRRAASWRLRAGVQTELDTLWSVTVFADPMPIPLPGFEPPPTPPPRREGGRAYGLRGYTDGHVQLARWLTARAGLEARRRTLIHRAPLFSLSESADPFLDFARAVDSAGVWSALDLVLGPLTVTPGLRADYHHVDLRDVTARHVNVDPRLTVRADLARGVRAQLAGGLYSAPPQVSVIEGSIAIGPLPVTDGTASIAGLSRAVQAEASVSAGLGDGWQGSFAAYHRQTRYAVDFGMLDKPFETRRPCERSPGAFLDRVVYRDIDTRAIGFEAMIRRDLGRSVTGWLSYSLGKIDRDFGVVRLPHDYDQRHALNATAQWRRGSWLFGASGHLHTGRPLTAPWLVHCEDGPDESVDVFTDPFHVRRPPLTWRVDVRAERAFQFSGWRMRLYVEMQNASLTREVVGYELLLNPHRVVEKRRFIPLPMAGVEVAL
jgi:hypothetical protein